MKICELLADPSRWTQGSFARTRLGEAVLSSHPAAHSFCLFGALNKCYPEEDRDEVITKLSSAISHGSIIGFNDESTHKQVLELVTKLDV